MICKSSFQLFGVGILLMERWLKKVQIMPKNTPESRILPLMRGTDWHLSNLL